MSRQGDKRIRLTYDQWWGMKAEVEATRTAADRNAREIRAVRDRFEREVRKVHDGLSAEIEAIRRDHGSRLGTLEQARAGSTALADRWTTLAETLRAEIAADRRHERFAPGQLAAVAQRIAEFDADSGGHAPDARFSMAWAAARDLAEMQVEVARRAEEWETLREACTEGLTALRQRWSELATQTLDAERDGRVLSVPVDVSFWSERAYATLGAELDAALAEVSDPETDTARLREMLEGGLDRFAGQLDRVLRDAFAAVRSSQLRAEAFDEFVNGLESRGYWVVDGQMGFVNGNPRADLVGTVTSHAGGVLRVRVLAQGRSPDELPILMEQVTRTHLPDRAADQLMGLVKEVAEDTARGWARVDAVEELPARGRTADDGVAEPDRG